MNQQRYQGSQGLIFHQWFGLHHSNHCLSINPHVQALPPLNTKLAKCRLLDRPRGEHSEIFCILSDPIFAVFGYHVEDILAGSNVGSQWSWR